MKTEEEKFEEYLKIKLEKLDFKKGDYVIVRYQHRNAQNTDMLRRNLHQFLRDKKLRIVFIPNQLDLDITVVKEI